MKVAKKTILGKKKFIEIYKQAQQNSTKIGIKKDKQQTKKADNIDSKKKS